MMNPALGALLLSVAPMSVLADAQSARTAAPDYRAALQDSHGRNPETIIAHRGAVRIDSPVGKGGVASEYDAPGQLPRLQVFRDSDGEVTLFWIRSQPRPRLVPDSQWENLGQERILAGEACRVQRRLSARPADDQRCVTPDGVVLAFHRDFSRMEAVAVERVTVNRREVTPPLQLLDPMRWGLTAARRNDAKQTGGDYTATFDQKDGVVSIRRSGDWTATVTTGAAATTTLFNEVEGVRIVVRDQYGPEIEFRRATQGRPPYWPFSPQPTTVNGKDRETVHGEACWWRYRNSSIDAGELECLTDDGAVLGVGFRGLSGVTSTMARTFVRAPVALGSIMPDPRRLSPQHYGLP